jgi:hypothetical protein
MTVLLLADGLAQQRISPHILGAFPATLDGSDDPGNKKLPGGS